MKIKNINKKLLAGILGFTILTTPLGLTACGHELNETKNRYEDVNDYVVITLETKNGKTIWLTEEIFDIWKGNKYYNVLNGEEIFIIIGDKSQIEGVELVSKEKLQQYLIGYDCVQNSYTKEEIEDLFERIKTDFYTEEKAKELVKK